VGAGVAGDDAGQGGFARARGAMQDQVANPIGSDGPAQQTAGPEDCLLPNEDI
jgi:hypothetical protein